MAISLCLGWQKGHLNPAGSGDPSTTPNSVILPHRSPDSGCFALISNIYRVHVLIFVEEKSQLPMISFNIKNIYISRFNILVQQPAYN